MAKKGKTHQPSLRGHREANVLRFRKKTTLIRIDADGNPVNTSTGDYLASHLFHSGGIEAPTNFKKKPLAIPSNVASYATAKANRPSTPVVSAGNEAEVLPPDKPVEPVLVFEKPPSIVHNPMLTKPKLSKKQKRIAAKAAKAKAVPTPVAEPVVAAYISPAVDAYIAPSPVSLFKLAKPVVHKPLDPKFWANAKPQPRTPSGRLIREFTHGKYKPEPSVVYTNPEAANDKAWEEKTQAQVSWFIAHVEAQNWPKHVLQYVRWVNDGPVINQGAIAKAVAFPNQELSLVKAMNSGLQDEWKMLDSALADREQETMLLRQELQATRNEVKLLEYDLAHRTGDWQSVEVMNKEMNIVGSAKPPEDADQLLYQFNVFQSQTRIDGLPSAFSRWVYNDPYLGKVIEDQADMLAEQRKLNMGNRNLVRFFKKFGEYHRTVYDESWVAHNKAIHDEYSAWWEEHYPKWWGKHVKAKLRSKQAVVTSVAHERNKHKGMANKAMKNLPTDSIYYSVFDRQRAINTAIAGVIIGKVKPSHARLNNPLCVEGDNRDGYHGRPAQAQRYINWWTGWIDHAEMKYHASSTTGRILIGAVKTYNSMVDLMNMPVDRRTKQRVKDQAMRHAQEKHQLDELRETRLENKAAKKKARELRKTIREAQRLAY